MLTRTPVTRRWVDKLTAKHVLQDPAVSSRQSVTQSSPYGMAFSITERSPPNKRTNSSPQQPVDTDADEASPEKKRCTSRHAEAAGLQEDCAEQHASYHERQATAPRQQPLPSDGATSLSGACMHGQAHTACQQQSHDQKGQGRDLKLKAAHDAYAAALHLGSQEQPQQAAVPLPQQLPRQHLHAKPRSHQHRQPQQLQQQQHQEKQLHQQPQQQVSEQQQALAAYQAALGRPAAPLSAKPANASIQHPGKAMPSNHQHTAWPAQQLQGRPQQLQQQVPDEQAADHTSVQHHQQLPQQVPEQAARHLGLPLPGTPAHAQNVYRAFQCQKDAIDYADACNKHAAGFTDHPSCETGGHQVLSCTSPD